MNWKLKFLIGLGIISTLFILFGCSDPAPETGKVLKREFTPEHWEGGYETYYTNEYVCGYENRYNYYSDKYEYSYDCENERVSHDRWEEHHIWRNDKWKFYLQKCETDGKKEKCHEGWREVTEHDYKRHSIGDFYPKTDEHPEGN